MQELKNSGFEKGTPENWQIYATGLRHSYIYPETGVDGSSVAIEYPTRETGKTAMLIQSVSIDNMKKYKLSGWMKTQNIVGIGAWIKVDWTDVAGKYINTSAIMVHKVGTIPWTYFEGVTTPNKNAANAAICLVLHDCSGKVWFDNISFASLATPVGTLSKIVVSPSTINITKDLTYQLIAKCYDENNKEIPYPELVWKSSDTSVATVSSGGLVKGETGTNDTAKIWAEGNISDEDIIGDLIFEEHFNGTTLDAAKWYIKHPNDGGVTVENSNLKISVNTIECKFTYTYGFATCRAKLAGAGNNRGWSSHLWLLYNPAGVWQEIDLVETSSGPIDHGNNPYGINKINSSVHCPIQPTGRTTTHDSGVDLSQDFHEYSFNWTPDYIAFYLDGVEYGRITSEQICIPSKPLIFIIGLCKERKDVNCWPSTEYATGDAYLYVDYVKVWRN